MNKYWKSIEEYEQENQDVEKQIPDESSIEALKASRRDFLKYFGFGVASAAVLSSCERPVKKAIPLLIQPEEIRPGVASYYASTFYNGGEAVPVLVKVRDGRPIKIEGNDLCKLTEGGTSAQVQASLLNLYDESRPKEPTHKNNEVDWDVANNEIIKGFKNVPEGKVIVFLTPSIISPVQNHLLSQLKEKYSNIKQVTLDSYSYSGIREAYKDLTGEAIIPNYRFDKAELAVSFNADFLGTWLIPTVFANQYAKLRKLNDSNKISKHIQYEGYMSLTGSNADDRFTIKPSDEGRYLVSLYNNIAEKQNFPKLNAGGKEKELRELAEKLIKASSKSLVVSGSNDKNIQLLVAGINQILNSFNNTIELNKTINLNRGNDKELDLFLNDCEKGLVGAVVCLESNPAYFVNDYSKLKSALGKVPLKINVSSQKDETIELCDYNLPASYYLESWGDAEIISGHYSLIQPVIKPIFNTRDVNQILLNWLEVDKSSHDVLKKYWTENILPKSKNENPFITSWKKTLSNGLFSINEETTNLKISTPKLEEASSVILKTSPEENLELISYQSVAMRDGRVANNPWLQELPDPVSKICWDNYFSVSPWLAKEKGWTQGDVISINGIELPIFIQPGNHKNVISVALGYGRFMFGSEPEKIGKKLNHIFQDNDRYVQVNKIVSVGSTYELATTQTHHSMEGRAIIRETSLNEYKQNPASGNEMHEKIVKHHTTLYKKHEYKGHHWALYVDLNLCTGCNACVVACSVENNVPVVGRNEVRRSHEMHWLRIDRYYTQKPNDPNSLRVVRQPVMCMHCDNAPCENVCPVAATNHSSEGINQMAYNRCIGTRYCNNNCPYKVRRFNWYDYTGADAIPFNRKDAANMTTDLKRMVLNPDVTVRAKGVIEKCSFCIQRIQEKKLEAKKEGRVLKDGDVVTACQQACPSKAMVFGDINDSESEVARMLENPRIYHLLEELHTLPSVGYLTKVRNIDTVISENSEHKLHS